ncbi:MAG: hypothetical protein CL489_05910 [Acidobacteria bacterium]|nr:hypothetical protein [Acidobacteriota bacterium]
MTTHWTIEEVKEAMDEQVNVMHVDEINKIPIMSALRNEFKYSIIEAKKVADVVMNEIRNQQEKHEGTI